MRHAVIYQTPDGREPFISDMDALRNSRAAARIWVRIQRAESGNLGDWRSISHGVIELRIHEGPGYRVYLGLEGPDQMVLLCAGEKSTQTTDIQRALEFWTDHRRRL